MLKIGLLKETLPGENRVAAVPETVAKMVKANMEVLIEAGAGLHAFIPDSEFVAAGAKIEANVDQLLQHIDILLTMNPPIVTDDTYPELDKMREQTVLIGPLYPQSNPTLLAALTAKKITAFALERLPRIARAQSMDILSSMSNLAGYKSVIMAADHLNKIFPMMTTAAGTIAPAKIIVIGAGVAGLQAIATARRLGGMVLALDTRPATAEQVKSLGAEFASLETAHETAEDSSGYAKSMSADFYQKEQDIIRRYSKEADVIITTALIPGQQAPILITEDMVKEMKAGSVIVDLAAHQGGNCALTVSQQTVVKYGTTIIGKLNLPSTLAVNASQLYAKNLFTFLTYLKTQLEANQFDLNDEIIKNCLITHRGEIMHAEFNHQKVAHT